MVLETPQNLNRVNKSNQMSDLLIRGGTRHASQWALRYWSYTAGPPGMVAAMRQMITTSGIDDDIRTEEFTGY